MGDLSIVHVSTESGVPESSSIPITQYTVYPFLSGLIPFPQNFNTYVKEVTHVNCVSIINTNRFSMYTRAWRHCFPSVFCSRTQHQTDFGLCLHTHMIAQHKKFNSKDHTCIFKDERQFKNVLNGPNTLYGIVRTCIYYLVAHFHLIIDLKTLNRYTLMMYKKHIDLYNHWRLDTFCTPFVYLLFV